MADSPSPSDFHREGYAVHRGVLPKTLLDFISIEYDILLANQRMRFGDPQVAAGYSAYGLNVSESLMQYLLPFMEQKTGLKLYPTYSYGRVYLKGAKLAKHRDRPSCEISLSVMIGQSGDVPWPLHFESLTGKTVALALEPGDLVVYKGMDLTHWREPFEGEQQLQLFLHYVRRDGSYANHRFDMRERLGAPPNQQTLAQAQQPAREPAKPQPFAIFQTPPTGGRR
jgi:hypothetical protein